MKKLMNKIERFCWNHPRFGISRLMLYIVIGNAVVWLASQMDRTGTLLYYLCFNPALFCHGYVWQILTFALVPDVSGILWLAIQLYFYYFIGSALEREWGEGKFTIYFFSGVLITAVYALIAYWITGDTSITVSSTYIYFSMFFAFATLWPDQQVLLFFIIPIKMKWLAIVNAGFFALEIVHYLLNGNVVYALVPVMAMLNYLLFCGDWLFDYFSPAHARQKARTIKFKQAAKKASQEQAGKPYIHKCAVCGRTDVDHPELEFRYCSRCAGYHCFCQDHINNHIHFTE